MLKEHPCLRPFLRRCRHCRILFFTDPRNKNRDDLGCPFGCSKTHRKTMSSQRSLEYYQSDEGKFKKKLLNGRYRGRTESTGETKDSAPCAVDLDKPMLSYLQLVTSIIEGRPVGLGEIVLMVKDILRQHSIGSKAKFVYEYS